MVSASESHRFFAEFSDMASKIEQAVKQRKPDECRELIQDLQSQVNAVATSLPGWDLGTYRNRLHDYKKMLDEIKGPKKKFGFSKAAKESQVNVPEETVNDDGGGDVPDHLGKPQCEFCLWDKVGETLELKDVLGDVELRNLSECKVRIYGSPGAIYMSNLNKCNIISDPVSSSILIVGCVESELTLCCQQLRIHKAKDTTFRLHITSRSIIEDCEGVRFGKLPESYEVADDLWSTSGLDRTKNNFECVDDFNWLNTSQPSPNWTLLQE